MAHPVNIQHISQYEFLIEIVDIIYMLSLRHTYQAQFLIF